MKAIGSIVLAKVDSEQEISGGIDAPKNDFSTGVVISVGPGVPDYPNMQCRVGDKIRWFKNRGERIIYEGEYHILLNEARQEIAAVI